MGFLSAREVKAGKMLIKSQQQSGCDINHQELLLQAKHSDTRGRIVNTLLKYCRRIVGSPTGENAPRANSHERGI